MSGFQEPENKPVKYGQPTFNWSKWVLYAAGLALLAFLGLAAWVGGD